MTSWASSVGSGLKFIFHWKSQLFVISKRLLRSFADLSAYCTGKKYHLRIALHCSAAFYKTTNLNQSKNKGISPYKDLSSDN